MYGVQLIPACPSSRLTAWAIDAFFSAAVMAAVMDQRVGTFEIKGFLVAAEYSDVMIVVVTALATQISVLGLTGRSVGMHLVDLQIVQDDGEPATWANMLRRPLGLLATAATLGLSGIVPFLNEQRRTLGDFLSGTRVVESIAPGKRISYDPWRIFNSVLKPMLPISLALAIAFLLMNKADGPVREVLLNAVVMAAVVTMFAAMAIAGIKVKTTRVRIREQGIQRSGLLGWSGNTVEWEKMSYAKIRMNRLFPHFEVHKHNHGHFKVPLESDSAQLTANELVRHNVRIEQ